MSGAEFRISHPKTHKKSKRKWPKYHTNENKNTQTKHETLMRYEYLPSREGGGYHNRPISGVLLFILIEQDKPLL